MQKRRNSSFNTLELRLFCIKSSILYHLGTQNYALFRPAFQSSTWEGSVAPKAVDGNAMDDTSCAITYDADYNPWWKVLLAYPIWVTHVEITNRQVAGGLYRRISVTHIS